MKTKIVTAIYNGLYGTELGGRPGRQDLYKYSLKSLMKMSNADFVCYTSDSDIVSLKNFFYNEHKFSEDRIKFKVFDLKNFQFTEKINKLKDIERTKKSDRCVEIQYSKFIWLENEIDDVYDYFYWFDAGLSHNGLIPNKHLLRSSKMNFERNYESNLFNDTFLTNLLNFSEEKISVVAKNNQGQHYWSGTVPERYYFSYNKEHHIIGGFFGGKANVMEEYCQTFLMILDSLLENEDVLYSEEIIMSLIYYNHDHLFNSLYFDLWWHENQEIPGIANMKEYINNQKSFYKILEELNK